MKELKNKQVFLLNIDDENGTTNLLFDSLPAFFSYVERYTEFYWSFSL